MEEVPEAVAAWTRSGARRSTNRATKRKRIGLLLLSDRDRVLLEPVGKREKGALRRERIGGERARAGKHRVEILRRLPRPDDEETLVGGRVVQLVRARQKHLP